MNDIPTLITLSDSLIEKHVTSDIKLNSYKSIKHLKNNVGGLLADLVCLRQNDTYNSVSGDVFYQLSSDNRVIIDRYNLDFFDTISLELFPGEVLKSATLSIETSPSNFFPIKTIYNPAYTGFTFFNKPICMVKNICGLSINFDIQNVRMEDVSRYCRIKCTILDIATRRSIVPNREFCDIIEEYSNKNHNQTLSKILLTGLKSMRDGGELFLSKHIPYEQLKSLCRVLKSRQSTL